MKSYIYGLYENEVLIDQTSIDELNLGLAIDLFYGEFGHVKCAHMIVRLIREEDEE